MAIGLILFSQLGFVATLVSPAVFTSLIPIGTYGFVSFFSLIVGFQFYQPDLNRRQEIWNIVQNLWSKNFWFGPGLDSFSLTYSSSVHGRYLASASDASVNSWFWGTIVDAGSLGLIIFWGSLGFMLYKMRSCRNQQSLAVMVILSSVIMSQFSEYHLSYVPLFSLVFYFSLIQSLEGVLEV